LAIAVFASKGERRFYAIMIGQEEKKTPPGARWRRDEKSVREDYFESGVSEFLSGLMH
jgi:hypothetical protein